ncbi:unnamed protein product [Vitrella brassicaformis CCMP3155]|uniref:Uncharacterized protein n=1 Tax=Vitrella brassicaformis (strain CCMP3155) TaxID=1169540 RepID=A0A0G4EK51_VITBC|nr:unnamed protein product [Vitrella brassicaformis CCMP3155]|eukprot:CEL96929.1 unnamed protein product [Vitrella brassicaformis CCMP3155]
MAVEAEAGIYIDIFDAVKAGSVDSVTALMDRDGTQILKKRDKREFTPFIAAAKDGQVEAMKVMYERCSSPELLQQTTQNDGTATYWAAMNCHLAAVNQLLDWGGPKLLSARGGARRFSPFMRAAENGHLDVLKSMYGKGGKGLLIQQDNAGQTALHVAVYKGEDAVVAQLLQWGGPSLLRIKDDSGETPWQYANRSPAIQGMFEICTEVPKKAVDVVLRQIKRRNIFAAVKAGDLTSVTQLMKLHGPETVEKRESGCEPCWYRTCACYLDGLYGMTPFLFASRKGHVEIINHMYSKAGLPILLQRGAGGWSAVHLAAMEGHQKAVAWLLEVGGFDLLTFRTTMFGCTPLHCAAMRGSAGVVETMLHFLEGTELLETKAAFKSITPFIFAVCYGHIDEGDTPLHYAVRAEQYRAVAQLMEWGGPILLEIKNNDGRTAWDKAPFFGRIRGVMKKYRQ